MILTPYSPGLTNASSPAGVWLSASVMSATRGHASSALWLLPVVRALFGSSQGKRFKLSSSGRALKSLDCVAAAPN